MKKNLFKLKVISILVLFSASIYSCQQGQNKQSVSEQQVKRGVPKIKFDTTYHDYGRLIQGEQASYTFKFTNIGTADLLIKDAYSTCGCTVPQYSKEPIKPGEKGTIEVVFDSAGKRGLQYKTVSLKLNTRISEKSLAIKAHVIVK